MTFLNKRATSIAAALTALTLTLAGCSRGDGESAMTTGADNGEMRVASLGLGDADTLLALDITPAAVAPWGAEGDVGPSGVGPWSEELLGDA